MRRAHRPTGLRRDGLPRVRRRGQRGPLHLPWPACIRSASGCIGKAGRPPAWQRAISRRLGASCTALVLFHISASLEHQVQKVVDSRFGILVTARVAPMDGWMTNIL